VLDGREVPVAGDEESGAVIDEESGAVKPANGQSRWCCSAGAGFMITQDLALRGAPDPAR
jgi:hypothetical protein